jgi:hypothetical protein
MGTGDQSGTWGSTTNLNLGTLMEQAIASYCTQQFASADVTLSLVNGADAGGNNTPGTIYTAGTTAVPVSARNLYIECQGTSSGNNLIVPTNTKLYYVYNNITSGSGTITVKTASGTGVAIPVGQRAAVMCNGTNVVQAETYFSSFSAAAINSTPIGATTPSTGKFTTLQTTSNVTFAAPASGIALTATGFAGSYAAKFIGSSTSGNSDGLLINAGTTSADFALAVQNQAASSNFFIVYGTGGATLGAPTGGQQGLGTLNATALYVNGVAVGTGSGTVTSVGMTVPSFLSVTPSTITSSGTFAVSLSGTALPVLNGGTGVTTSTGSGSVVLSTSPTLTTPVLGTPTSGTLSNCTVDGTAGNNVGFINLPQLSKTSAYVLAAADRGKHVSITTGGVTVNVSTFAAGDAVTIYNNSASSQTITQGTSATMYLAGTATTGNRTLAQRGVCTILCVTGGASAVYVISGGGLT